MLVALAAGINVTGFRGPGKIGDHADLSALATSVRDDRYPDHSEEVKQRCYQNDVASHL
jgi:hypothetical protein